ncbi:MAG: NAD(P)-dependent oxidoreductase [Oligosphaeraceae bacterium]|nr:NAD(P)-dependent oxidoreductase [Oligosphaeraceae bacterium]
MINKILNETELEFHLSEPSPALVDFFTRLDGDLAILGIGGKIGFSLGQMAIRAVARSGVKRKVYGISRFSDTGVKEKLLSCGIEAIVCDLLDRDAVNNLPRVKNVIFMAGRKFGTSSGGECTTWAMNTAVPANVAEHFRESRIVVFSTGCVYPLATAASGGCTEETRPEPLGEYAQSCLGRERIFEYYASRHGTKVLQFRLNYAIDLRYGVLYDIAAAINEGRAVNNSVGSFNAIWQADVNDWALRSLEHCGNPAMVLNITGPETTSVEYAANRFGELLGKPVCYSQPVSGESGYLNNAAKAFELFGYPRISMGKLIQLQAEWLLQGGRTLNKATHFEVSDGKF